MRKFALLGIVGAVASAANAQLIVGFDDTSAGVITCYEVRVSDGTNVATPLFSDIEVWALASDNVNRKLYIGSGSLLYVYDGSGSPTLVGNFNFEGTTQSIVGMAFADGNLYVTKNISNEAVYKVNPATGEMTIALDYTDADYDFGGFDYDNGSFYGANDDTTPFGSGLFSIDLGGTITKIASYPAGETDIDGLAVGGGIAYLIEDEPGLTIHRYDLGSNSYLSPITSPFGTSEIFSAGAYAPWIPAPGVASIFCVAGLGALRRRR